MRRLGLPTALLLMSVVCPRPASATLTTRVIGLEAALNDSWPRSPVCHSLMVEDLALRDGSFALTTTGPNVFRIARDDRGGVVCTARGWHVGPWEAGDALSGPCAQEICQVIDAHSDLVASLDAAMVRAPTALDEAPIPLTWSTPFPKGLSLIWFLSCLATLLLLLGLPLVARFTGREVGPKLLKPADWAVILIIATAGVGLRATIARRAMVELDETVSVGYDSLWREFDGRETVMNPPLYRVISAPVSARTHGAAMPGRAVPVLLGFPLIIALAYLGAMLAGRRAAYVAALLAAVHPWLVMATVYHRGYAPLVVTTALTLLAVAVALRSDRAIYRHIAAVCMTSAFLSHYSGAAVVAGAALWILVADRRRWREWIGPAGLAVLLCAPFVPAALSGAHAKGNSPIGTAGAAHATRLALSMTSVVGGLVRPRLETPIYLEQSHQRLVINAVLVGVALLFGLWCIARRFSLGLLVITLLAGALPVLMAYRLTTVREFQGVEAAVPAVILIAGLAATRSRFMGVVSAALLAFFLFGSVRALPFDSAARTTLDAVSSFIRGEQKAWPVFVWSSGSPSYSDVALDLGLSRPVADASYEGRDAKVRALRSCSTAAVRDAARTNAGAVITVVSIDHGCNHEALAGRAVSCDPSRTDGAGFVITTCRVDGAALRPVSELPSLVPAHLRRRVDRAIPPGHEQLFMGACAPPLGKADAQGNVLAGISIGMEYAKYQLRPTVGPIVSVLASPRFSDEEIVGTDLLIEPPEETLPPEARAATDRLKASLLSHLTTPVWNDVYGLVTNGAGGHTPVKPRPWLILSGFGGLVLLLALVRGRRRQSSSETSRA